MADNDLDVWPQEDISGATAALQGGRLRLHQTSISLDTVSAKLSAASWDAWLDEVMGDLTPAEFGTASAARFGSWWTSEVTGKTCPNGDAYAARIRSNMKYFCERQRT